MSARGLKIRHFINTGLLLLSAFVVTSCSEGGVGGDFVVADGGISGTGISSGSISGFSSVIINGRTLDVEQTQIFVDEMPATVADLKVGHVIRVDADFDNGTAERIDYVETVLGPITSTPVFNADTLAGSMDVLGQSVLTNSITIFDGVDPSTLTVNDVLEVSGLRNANGAIVARYINLKTAPVVKYRVLGRVTGVDPTSFEIGNLRVEYLSADTSEFGLAGIQDGDEVRVKAVPSAFDATSSVLVADEITRSTLSVVLSNGDALELEGVITSYESLSNMTVNDLQVDASSATIENGTEADLKLDVLVEVEGDVSESDVLIASKIKIVPLSNIRVEASVDSVNLDTQSLFVLGKEFFLDDKTQLKDNSSLEINDFSLNDLFQGDRVELRAFSLDGKFILTRLERDDSDPRTRVQGPVIEKSANTLTVLGITLSVNGNTEFKDFDDQPVPTQQEFFDLVQLSDVVKAVWDDFTDTSVPVDELSLEID